MKRQEIERQQEKYEKRINVGIDLEYIRIVSNFDNQIDETRFAKDINKKIHEKHKNLQEDMEIPFLFIDPVVDIFEDPCDIKAGHVTSREKEQFQKYTDKYT